VVCSNEILVGVPGGARKLTTPALIVDARALSRNISTMQEMCRAAGLKLRPHGKTHKCSALARAQLDAGAVGVCAATGREAISFARGGLSGLLVTTPIVQEAHLNEISALNREGADLTVVVDSPEGIDRWERALGESPSHRLSAMVDLDIGMGRTGAASTDLAVELARRLEESKSLTYRGLQAYSGRVQHIERFLDRKVEYERQLERLRSAVDALTYAGLRPAIVSGGGTGTFFVDREARLFTESQAGSYCFMDVDYDAVELGPRDEKPFEFSLHLRSSVVSANQPGFVSIDAGFKSLSTDGPLPRIRRSEWPGARYEFFGDEFGMVIVPEGSARPAVGDIVDLEVSHCDPTVNLHDFLHVVDEDVLVEIWRVDARGAL
jgi:3-hydroxy-D-aspartate aldolase